jgi:hypothetical protein
MREFTEQLRIDRGPAGTDVRFVLPAPPPAPQRHSRDPAARAHPDADQQDATLQERDGVLVLRGDIDLAGLGAIWAVTARDPVGGP